MRSFTEDLPSAGIVFAPYFYIEPSRAEQWLSLNLSLMEKTAGLALPTPVHGVVCADKSHLGDRKLMSELLDRLPRTGIKGVLALVQLLS